jgi:hypothetical protein
MPSAVTSRQCQGDHGNRSSRAGMSLAKCVPGARRSTPKGPSDRRANDEASPSSYAIDFERGARQD